MVMRRVSYGTHAWWVQTWNSSGCGPWSAQGTYVSRPDKPAMVTDANGTYIGTYLYPNRASIDIDGLPADAVVLQTGFKGSLVTLFYTTADCSGTTYSYAVFPDRLEFTTGLTAGYLTRGTPITVVIPSIRFAYADGTFSLCSMDEQTRTAMPVVVRDMTSEYGSLVTPFKVVRQAFTGMVHQGLS